LAPRTRVKVYFHKQSFSCRSVSRDVARQPSHICIPRIASNLDSTWRDTKIWRFMYINTP
jgi:hypothetical protein